MIVIDSSALIAILQHEPERHLLFKAIVEADRRLISAVTFQETAQVQFSKLGAQGSYDLDDLLKLVRAEIVPHDEELAALAVEAFNRFGKGIHPGARLNFVTALPTHWPNRLMLVSCLKATTFRTRTSGRPPESGRH